MHKPQEHGPLVILAFDSADAGLIERWANQGHLPTIKGLLDRGVQSRLGGPELISEAGVWVSLFSGVSRAQHGYYYWRPLQEGTYQLKFSDQRVEGVSPFWGHLRGAGKRVAVIDAPEVHCTTGLHGVQLANWAPHNRRFATHSEPSSLLESLRRQFGSTLGVEEKVPSTLENDLKIHRGLLDQIEQKAAICRHLLAQDRFDLFVVGFHESHIAGHQFWKYSTHASEPAAGGGPLRDATRDVYQAIDRVFGELIGRFPDNATVLVVSNMGVQADYPNLELTQAFCRELGYHRVKPSASSWSALPRMARRIVPQGWQRAISERLPDKVRGTMLSGEWLGGTDWSATTVFPVPAYFLGFLRVNLRGREPEGVVGSGDEYVHLLDRVEADLRRLVDPVSGGPAVGPIARTIDHFDMDIPDSLPDIFFDWLPTPYPKWRVEHPDAVLEQKDMFFSRDTRHDLCGFLAAAGPGIPGGTRIDDLSVLDFAPTCLQLIGQTIPSEMTGTGAAEIIRAAP